MVDSEFYRFLIQRLQKPLPGNDAHLRMAPTPSGTTPSVHTPAGTFHNSSILIPMYETEPGKPELILTLRTHTISHGGQISFPGGRSDSEETPESTALRELHEEVGIHRSDVDIAGSLSPLYLERSNNLIKPFVGYLQSRPSMTLNPAEVQEAFSTSVEELLNSENYTMKPWSLRGVVYDVPYWTIHDVPLWGATAMIINELLDLYREHKGLTI